MEYIPVILAAEIFLNIVVNADYSGSDSDDNQEEILAGMLAAIGRKKMKVKTTRIQNYVEHVVPSYTPQQFQQHFRLTQETFQHLIRVIGPRLQKETPIGRKTINVQQQLLAVLWLSATPDSYRSVGDRFNMGKSSLSVCFFRVIRALCTLAPAVIKWPSVEEREEIARKFRRIARFPNVIGAIDGTLIPIKAPKEDPQSYVTRKCNHAMTLQAVCNSELRFLDTFVGYPGSVHDARVFRNSDLYKSVVRNTAHFFTEEQHIIGDKAYPVLPWCLTPYKGNPTPAQKNFNNILSNTRQVIERSFALLFGRFRRLKYLDMNRTDFIPATILAACVLHNICLEFNDLEVENYIRMGHQFVHENDEIAPNIQDELAGNERRALICNNLFNN